MFGIWQTTYRMVIRHDPQIGHRYVPNVKARIPNELGGSFLVTNEQGFRSNINYRNKKGEKPRILFFGDSFCPHPNLVPVGQGAVGLWEGRASARPRFLSPAHASGVLGGRRSGGAVMG